MNRLRSTVSVGDRVRVRQQRWRVADVRSFDACEIVTLVGIGAANRGMCRRLIAPFDIVASAADNAAGLRLVGIRAWRHACRNLLASQGPADTLHTARDARIDVLPHQLEPVLAIVRGLGCRVLIADEVGLGKTIQAGLIIAELRARQAADRILVVTPAGLREQWAAELAERFGLDPVLVDTTTARRRAAELPLGTNPWDTIPLAVSSIDYVKRADVLSAVAACRWDVVVVDEAHGLTPGSERRQAIGAICDRAGYVVLLTATPHSGDPTAFESLRSVGDRAGDPLLVFRRRRRDVGLVHERRVHSVVVRPSDAEHRMHARLAHATRGLAAATADAAPDPWIAISVLHKRSFSCPSSLERTLERRLSALPLIEPRIPMQRGLPLDDPSGELDAADEAPAWAATALDWPVERALLEPVLEAARAASAAETKVRALVRLVRRLLRLGEAMIVFTEYRDTLARLRGALGLDCAMLHGGLSGADRRSELDSFTTGRRRVLLATDAAGEGLNLHRACRVVINLELPWNPMRLEQRIGRVDRIGQRRRVHVFHLIARDTGETRVLDYLKSKIERAKFDIDTADPLGDEEREVARAIVAGGDAGVIGTTSVAGRLPQLRLISDAARAAAHVRVARAYLGSDRPIVATDTGIGVVSVTRKRPARLELAGRWLAVVCDALHDQYGHLAASRLLPVLVTPMGARGPRFLQWLRAVAPQIERQAAASYDAEGDGRWAAESTRIHHAFWATRRARELAVASSMAHDTALKQPGLFDRRALHAAAEDAARAEAARDVGGRRIRAFEAAAVLHPALHLAALLLPGRRW